MPGVRRQISSDVKRIVVEMSQQADVPLTRAQIRSLTGVAESTQRRINALYRCTGEVAVRPIECGRRRVMHALDVMFLEGLVERRPDITLLEMQQALGEVCDVDVSISTICRTLKRVGFTRKQVCTELTDLAYE
ncbi:hypothetical protein EDD15DRAFT_2184751 [Pisolithus albus]|nr:hypothetical protein EDD15DRAFT_2184751 [Pisolithus albus]